MAQTNPQDKARSALGRYRVMAWITGSMLLLLCLEVVLHYVVGISKDRLGVFQYSDEEGTAAYDLPDKVPAKTIERRWREVMALQKRINREQNQALVGKRLEVLVEGASPETEHLLIGRHQGQAPEIDGQVYINDSLAYPGEFVTVEVTEAHDYDVVGKVVARDEAPRRVVKARDSVPLPVLTAPR